MVLENFVSNMTEDGDTKLVYDLEDLEQYKKQKALFMEKIKCGSMMVGIIDGQKLQLANKLTNETQLDSILSNERITDKMFNTVLMAG